MLRLLLFGKDKIFFFFCIFWVVFLRVDIGVIGGSGFYKLFILENQEKIEVETPFGNVELTVGELEGLKIAFLPRHGEKHSVPPHLINYRANAYAMHLLGVRKVIATSAVGSLRRYILPGDIVVPDQIIDFTKNRVYTFFDGNFKVELPTGEVRSGVYHVDVTEPYCEELRKIIIDVAEKRNMRVHPRGTYICTEGPRFETPAEISFFQMIGGDVVGMTNSRK